MKNTRTHWKKYLSIKIYPEEKSCFVAFADFHTVNTHTVAYFELS